MKILGRILQALLIALSAVTVIAVIAIVVGATVWLALTIWQAILG